MESKDDTRIKDDFGGYINKTKASNRKEKKIHTNFSTKAFFPSKTAKTKDGSPGPTNSKKLNRDSRKSLRLNMSQEARLKNNTLRKVKFSLILR